MFTLIATRTMTRHTKGASRLAKDCGEFRGTALVTVALFALAVVAVILIL